MKIPSREQYQKWDMEIQEEKEKLENMFSQKQYGEICRYMNQEKASRLALIDPSFFVMKIMAAIQEEEEKKGIGQGVFWDRCLRQVIDHYQNIVFLLRRLEFEFPEEYQKELLSYIEDQNVSIVCIIGIIQAHPYFYSKERILHNFITLVENE